MIKRNIIFLLFLLLILQCTLLIGCTDKQENTKENPPAEYLLENDPATLQQLLQYTFLYEYEAPGSILGYDSLFFGSGGTDTYLIDYQAIEPYVWGVYLQKDLIAPLSTYMQSIQTHYQNYPSNYHFSILDEDIVDGKYWYAYQNKEEKSSNDYIVVKASNYKLLSQDIGDYRLVLCVQRKNIVFRESVFGQEFNRTMPMYCRLCLAGRDQWEIATLSNTSWERSLFEYVGLRLEVGSTSYATQSAAFIPQRGTGQYTQTKTVDVEIRDGKMLVKLPRYVYSGKEIIDLLNNESMTLPPYDGIFGPHPSDYLPAAVEAVSGVQSTQEDWWFDYLMIKTILVGTKTISTVQEDQETALSEEIRINTKRNIVGLDMPYYFQHLLEYSAMNSHGSCGYVSLIQYLSYYDTFFCDNIIPENYDRHDGNKDTLNEAITVSPGVTRQSYNASSTLPDSTLALYNSIQAGLTTDYQMYLMNIKNNALSLIPEAYTCSIGMWDYHYLFDVIFGTGNYNYTYTSLSYFGASAKANDSSVISWYDTYVKNKLDAGKPVILHIVQYDEDYHYTFNHSVVAYYYDEDGIHANFGWNTVGSCDMLLNNYYIKDAGVLDESYLPAHHHSNGYIASGIEYCACGLPYSHNYTYAIIDDNYHVRTCSCGDYTTMSHTFTPGHSTTTHFEHCEACGYYKQTEINFNYSQHNDTYHYAYCSICNDVHDELHSWVQVSLIAYRCTKCIQLAVGVPIVHDSIEIPEGSRGAYEGVPFLYGGHWYVYYKDTLYILQEQSDESDRE